MFSSGMLVVDTCSLRLLQSDEARARFQANTRVTDWRATPSLINLLEIAQNPNDRARARDLAVLRYLADGSGLLPWPETWLKETGLAVAEGKSTWASPWSGAEHLLDPQTEPDESFRRAAEELLEKRIAVFEEMHRNGRPKVQGFLKERGMRNAWSSMGEFLDEVWMAPGHLDDALEALWKHVELPGDAPIALLKETEVWRFFFEVHGAAVYERAIVTDQSKRVHLPDLFQLIYLAGTRRRSIATEDKPFRRLTHSLLHGRHPRASASSLAAFLS